MDTKTALSIYQTYTLEKIGAFSKQQLIAQYAQCEEISKLKKEMSANTAATNKILRNQLKELERQEKQRYYKSLIFNMGLALKRITEQENENFRTFVMNLFIKPMLTYSKEAMDNLDEIQDKEYAMNVLRQIEDASTNKLSDTFNKSVWSRYKPSVVEEELTKIKESISEKKKEIDKINSEYDKKVKSEIVNTKTTNGCLTFLVVVIVYLICYHIISNFSQNENVFVGVSLLTGLIVGGSIYEILSKKKIPSKVSKDTNMLNKIEDEINTLSMRITQIQTDFNNVSQEIMVENPHWENEINDIISLMPAAVK